MKSTPANDNEEANSSDDRNNTSPTFRRAPRPRLKSRTSTAEPRYESQPISMPHLNEYQLDNNQGIGSDDANAFEGSDLQDEEDTLQKG